MGEQRRRWARKQTPETSERANTGDGRLSEHRWRQAREETPEMGAQANTGDVRAGELFDVRTPVAGREQTAAKA
jgi:hypothetical protein